MNITVTFSLFEMITNHKGKHFSSVNILLNH